MEISFSDVVTIISDVVTIIVVLMSPLIAVQVTDYLNSKKEDKQRKRDIFKSLMCTRDHATSVEHVRALNLIEFEFKNSNPKEKKVLDALKIYLSLLGEDIPTEESLKAKWWEKRVGLFIDLLHEIAIVLDYDFDKKYIQTSSYGIASHANIEDEESKIRKGIIEILKYKQVLPVHITNPSTDNNDDDSKSK